MGPVGWNGLIFINYTFYIFVYIYIILYIYKQATFLTELELEDFKIFLMGNY